MDTQDQRVEHVFLVRMWLERGGGEAQWRGSVQHVASGRRMFVGSPGEVGDFIALQLPVKSRGAEAGDKSVGRPRSS